MLPFSAPIKVVNNHLGFRNFHGRKQILVPDVPEIESIMGSHQFVVFEQNDFSKYSMNDPEQLKYTYRAEMTKRRTDFGVWYEGDFSHLTTTGVYQAFVGNTPGVNFAIRDDVWCRILPDLMRYFQVQSCGRKVVGWHDACHLDDGYIRELDRYLDAAGGWHDAGDFRKWATSIALNAIALLVGHRLWGGREAELGLEEGCFLREAMVGCHYYLGIQDEATGALFHNIGGGRDTEHDNLDCRYTDNVKRSGDERRIWPGPWAMPPAKFTTLYLLYANALKAVDPELAERCYQAACRSHRFDLQGDPGATVKARLSGDADRLQWRMWACLEFWRYTGSDDHRAEAIATLDRFLGLQVTDYIGGQQLTRGFFRSAFGADDYHRKHIGAHYPIWIIAEFIDAFPTHPAVSRWKDAIAMWVDDYALVFAARNPFGLLPYALYSAPPADHPDFHYRPLGDRLCFRYFMAANHFGSNARSSLAAVAFAAAARVLDRPELLTNGYRLLEWTIGNNPFQISTCTGVGVFQPCALSFQMGNIPGGVTMGVKGRENDQPWYHHPWVCCDEYYGFQTSHFTWAVLALQALRG